MPEKKLRLVAEPSEYLHNDWTEFYTYEFAHGDGISEDVQERLQCHTGAVKVQIDIIDGLSF